jgi:hypothetical protein
MDVVPVIIKVEERFGVSIPDENWPATVGELYLYLLRHVRRAADSPCPTSQAFYQVRRTLISEFARSRKEVRPTARICDLFPAATRGVDWPRLAAALGLSDLPEFPRRRVPSLRALRFWLAGVTALWWLVYPILLFITGDELSLSYGLLIWFLLALLVFESFGIVWVVWALDYWERVRVPRVRDIVVPLAVRQAMQSASQDAAAQELWDELRAIIAAEAAVPVGEIHSSQRWGDLPDYL